ncbi:MAG: hypothetical protein L3K15_07250 [Thermoplasmata archaeon]|nr:hypothetical protein [Thermoplasmata archaeon]
MIAILFVIGTIATGTWLSAPTPHAPLTLRTGGASGQLVNLSGLVGTLLAGKTVGSVPPGFWAVDLQTASSTGISSNPAVGQFVNATPFTWMRYGQGNDECNISANAQYGSDGSVTGGCGFNLVSYKQWCSSRGPACHTVLSLPGENNNSAEDAAIAKWIVHTVGFQPDFWSIGNEPMLWKHYGIPWTKWAVTDHKAPTPLGYALDVKAAIAAVKAVDPAGKFIGIQADCECSPTWFKDVVKLNGPNLAAIAYHTYPSTALTTTETLAQFYGPLASAANITTSYATVRADIRGQCASCGKMPIFVGEYNGGPGWAASNWGGSYANAVFLAASTVQALQAGVSMLTIFNLQTYATSSYGFSMMNGSSTVGPTGLLYSTLLRHLVGGTVYAVPIKGAANHAWAIVESNGLQESLLVVNTDLGHKLTLSLGGVLPSLAPETTYLWKPGQAKPTSSSGLLGSSIAVPSQGIVLVDLSLAILGPAVPLDSGASSAANPPLTAGVSGGGPPLVAPSGMVAVAFGTRPGLGGGIRSVSHRASVISG